MLFLTLACTEPCPDVELGQDSRAEEVDEPERSTVSDADGWVQVATGLQQTCSLDFTGRVDCRGCETALLDSSDFTKPEHCDPPPGRWESVVAGVDYTCVVGSNGSLCNMEAPAPEPLTRIVMGGSHACGFGYDGGAVCWTQVGPTEGTAPPDVDFIDLSTTSGNHCGIRKDDGKIECWGTFSVSPPDGRYTAIDAKAGFHCALSGTGVECWGETDPLPSIEGSWDHLTVGAEHACVYNQTDFHCWGATEYSPAEPIEEGIQMMDAGWFHTCAVRGDGRVECWGDPTYGAIYPP